MAKYPLSGTSGTSTSHTPKTVDTQALKFLFSPASSKSAQNRCSGWQLHPTRGMNPHRVSKFTLLGFTLFSLGCALPQGTECDPDPTTPNQCGGAGRYCSRSSRVCTTQCSQTAPCAQGFTCGFGGECWPGGPAQLVVRTSYQGTFQLQTMAGIDRGTLDGGSSHTGTFLPREVLLELAEGRALVVGVPLATVRTTGERSSLATTTCTPSVANSALSAQTGEPVELRRVSGENVIEVFVPWPVQHTARTCAGATFTSAPIAFTDFTRVGAFSEDVLLDGGVLTFDTMLSSEQRAFGDSLQAQVAHKTTLEIIPAP